MFSTVAEIAVRADAARVYEHGWQSWSPTGTYPVTGKATIGGQPAQGVLITFEPVDPTTGQSAQGQVDDQGMYKLFTGAEGHEGAKPGKYKVVLKQVSSPTIYEPGKAPAASGGVPGVPPNTFPDEWASAQSTPKEVEVKAETNDIPIEVPARSG